MELLSLSNAGQEESSKEVYMRVQAARERQLMRQGKCNAHLSVAELEQYAKPEAAAEQLFHHAMAKFNLSARVYHRIIKLARTFADLEAAPHIATKHLSEALLFRFLDRSRP